MRVHDLMEDNKNFYVVSELVQGGELYDFLIKKKRLLPSDVAKIIKQLLLALNHMHTQKIAHRDLKPENILMASNDEIKLADFGFAVFVGDEQQTLKLGSPIYMAPEIVNSEEYGLKVDIWALGIITATLLTGKSVYRGKTKSQIFYEIQNERPNIHPEMLSTDAKDFIESCLIQDPSKRKTALELLQSPFLTARPASSAVANSPQPSTVVQNLKQFTRLNRF